jgi:copper chaperone NosL
MTGSSGRFAAQLVIRGQEPLFFDDIGCLRGYLENNGPVSEDGAAYVVDHRTGAWVRAGQAVYMRNDRLETPMGSHLLAHESAASRDADPDSQGGTPLTAAAVFANLSLPAAP